MPSVVANLISDLRPVRRPARVLYAGTGFWLFSAAIHLGALALDGWQWSGSVSFRKPLVFSLSMGLLLGTVGWVLDRLPDRPRLAGTLAWSLLVSTSIEIGLITMQTWRGRASHFNEFTPDDLAIFVAMGVTVGVMSLAIVALLVWSVLERPRDPLMRMAVIGGLVLVVTGLGLGQWIIELGNEYVAANGRVPETVISGERGVAKFPHGVAFHGIQVLILSAVILGRGGFPVATRRRLMRLIFWSYTGVLVFASAQTIAGHAPLDITIWSLALGVSLVGVGYGVVRGSSGLSAHGTADREVAEAVR